MPNDIAAQTVSLEQVIPTIRKCVSRVRTRIPHPHDADDLVQIVSMKLAKSRKPITEKHTAYVSRIVSNELSRMITGEVRRRKRETTYNQSCAAQLRHEPVRASMDDAVSFVLSEVGEEDAKVLDQALCLFRMGYTVTEFHRAPGPLCLNHHRLQLALSRVRHLIGHRGEEVMPVDAIRYQFDQNQGRHPAIAS